MSEVGGGHVVDSTSRGRPWPVVRGVGWGPATGQGQECVRDEAVRLGCWRSWGAAAGQWQRWEGCDPLEVCLVVTRGDGDEGDVFRMEET